MKRPGDQILLVIATLCVIVLLWTALKPDSTTRFLIAAGTHHGPPPPPAIAWRPVDRTIREVMPPEGNVVAHFSTTPEFAQMFMYRADYALWPRRLYVSTPDRVINSAGQLLAAEPPSDRAWLAAHDVHERLEFQLDRSKLRVHKDTIPPQ